MSNVHRRRFDDDDDDDDYNSNNNSSEKPNTIIANNNFQNTQQQQQEQQQQQSGCEGNSLPVNLRHKLYPGKVKVNDMQYTMNVVSLCSDNLQLENATK